MTVRTHLPDDLHIILSPSTAERARFRTLKEWGFPISYGHFRDDFTRAAGTETVKTLEMPRWVWDTLLYFNRRSRQQAVELGRAISSTRALKQIGRDLAAHASLDAMWRIGGMHGVYGALRGMFGETKAGERTRRRTADQPKDTRDMKTITLDEPV